MIACPRCGEPVSPRRRDEHECVTAKKAALLVVALLLLSTCAWAQCATPDDAVPEIDWSQVHDNMPMLFGADIETVLPTLAEPDPSDRFPCRNCKELGVVLMRVEEVHGDVLRAEPVKIPAVEIERIRPALERYVPGQAIECSVSTFTQAVASDVLYHINRVIFRCGQDVFEQRRTVWFGRKADAEAHILRPQQ